MPPLPIKDRNYTYPPNSINITTMNRRCSCIICKKEMSYMGITTHVNRTHLGQKQYSNGHNGKYEYLASLRKDTKQKKVALYLINPNKCLECNGILNYDKRHNTFCTRGCAAKHSNRKRCESNWSPSITQRKQISEKITGKPYYYPHDVTSICDCGNEFTWLKKQADYNKNHCSRQCATKFSAARRKINCEKRKNMSKFRQYKLDCGFKFSLLEYKDEFNLRLIEEHGWYRAANRGNNLTGVSRDHMLSVRDGFDAGIDPSIISHPANCKLMLHTANAAKNRKSSITLDALLKRIAVWDAKYKK